MNNKTCATCINNDNGLCDRKGILIHEDDTCDQHKEDWREKMLESLTGGMMTKRKSEKQLKNLKLKYKYLKI